MTTSVAPAPVDRAAALTAPVDTTPVAESAAVLARAGASSPAA
jgi:hypothetical protein